MRVVGNPRQWHGGGGVLARIRNSLKEFNRCASGSTFSAQGSKA